MILQEELILIENAHVVNRISSLLESRARKCNTILNYFWFSSSCFPAVLLILLISARVTTVSLDSRESIKGTA